MERIKHGPVRRIDSDSERGKIEIEVLPDITAGVSHVFELTRAQLVDLIDDLQDTLALHDGSVPVGRAVHDD